MDRKNKKLLIQLKNILKAEYPHGTNPFNLQIVYNKNILKGSK